MSTARSTRWPLSKALSILGKELPHPPWLAWESTMPMSLPHTWSSSENHARKENEKINNDVLHQLEYKHANILLLKDCLPLMQDKNETMHYWTSWKKEKSINATFNHLNHPLRGLLVIIFHCIILWSTKIVNLKPIFVDCNTN